MKIEQNKILKEFSTFRVGGPAKFFCAVQNEKQLKEAVAFAHKENIPIFVLGGGSNILISDKGFHGLVIKMEMKGVEYVEDEDGNTRVTAMAGEDWDKLVAEMVERGLHGLENLSLIPGTVGATPVQNIGAYGSEVKDTIDTVRIFDTEDGHYKDFTNYDCHFEYRGSHFKKEAGRYIVVSVTFLLKKNGKVHIGYRDLQEYFSQKGIDFPTLTDVRKAVIEIRTRKLPDVKLVGTAGSFFKNPIVTHGQANDLEKKHPGLPVYPFDDMYVKVSLAWIIDKVCGFKGVSKGDVGTYKNQALVLVNNGSATAEEIISFAHEIKKIVKEKTGIVIEEEVQII